MDSKQHQSSSSDTHKVSPENDTLESTQPHHQPQRTFKLFEFNYAFGCDAHHFIFIQRESNSEALATFEENLGVDMDCGAIQVYSRIFTETDLKNIQASCLEILAAFSATSDYVTYRAILGKIEVESCDDSEWFDETFSAKYPYWDKGFNIDSSQVIDLEKDIFV
ncbi:unnamed protein product [Clonostachys chloroleuca]|uniref:Uncharacterized protein n=1 Tax=Clonostachys chloroleuca TaxID=1926264 RepID=A0AA35M8D4_9HYPO|nr:unnamed protein product [Clonostachys chloroleuca]